MDIQTVIKAIPGVTEPQAEKLCRYYEMLMDWNSRMNLTAITGEDEVLKKHFADSLLPLELIPEGANLIDVGTGAGFPGLPIAIARPDVKVTLLDSLNKRIGFLREVCKELDINADCIHDRAEDGGRNPALREKFDIAVSRAVARVSPLAEYTVPFLKVGGRSMMYKGPQAAAELKEGERALELLCCTGEIRSYPAEWGERSVIILTKQKPTPRAYPRKAGTVEKIVPNPNQPRVTFDDDTIAELAQSISQVGLIQPLVVRRSGSGYELVAGERRLRACKSLGMETVTCIVEDSMQEESSAMVALIENLQREDLHYMEEAQCYYALLNNYNLTQEELAKRLGRSQSSIANKLRLLRLSPDVVSAIRENGLSERHARAVLKLKDEEVQLAVIKRTAEKNLSVKDTERLVEKTLDKMYDEKRPGAAPRPAIIRQVRDYRLFMNTVNSAIAVLRESGMNVEVEQEDLQNGVDIHIRITNE